MKNQLAEKRRPQLVAFILALVCLFGLSFTESAAASPKVVGAIKAGAVIGKLYVPRYGKTYARTIAEGTASSVLNGPGLGHYTGTQFPGEEGNFAMAGHRFANGGPMLKIDTLRAGDYAFVQTKETWYTYKWLATKIVKPSDVAVVYPIPEGLASAESGGHYMTFTSCTPVHINTHRIVAWFELVDQTPASSGKPALLQGTK